VNRTHVVAGRDVGPFRVRRRYALSRIRRPRLAAPAPERFRIEFDVDGRPRRIRPQLHGGRSLVHRRRDPPRPAAPELDLLGGTAGPEGPRPDPSA
jgi:hypothetical protein